MTSYKAGDKVRCGRFSGEAVLMEGPNAKGEYRLALGNLSLWVPGEELKPVTGKLPDPERGRKLRKALSEIDGTAGPERLDLHGLTVAQAVEVLERCIDRAILNGTPRIEVIHGIGSGALKKAVLEYLSRSSHVSSFKGDDANPGTTWVNL